MTVADVIKLSKAGVSDDLIIQQLKKKNHVFDLSTDRFSNSRPLTLATVSFR